MSNLSFANMSDEELEQANRQYMADKESIRAAQLDLNAELTERAQQGIRKVRVEGKSFFGKSKGHLLEVPIGASQTDILALQGIESEEEVIGLG